MQQSGTMSACLRHYLNIGADPAFVGLYAVALALARRGAERTTLRLGLPSKGRMAEDTQQLLKVTHQTAN